MSASFKYMNEASIDPDLVCNICLSPLTDPCCTPCRETYCHKCITYWIQEQKASCPHCRQPLTINALTQVPRSLQNMLGRLQVQCIICGQNGLQRSNFDEHMEKECPKAIVHCPSADIKCPWTGQREHLKEHLHDCRFGAMRPVITKFTIENQQLQEQVAYLNIQVNEYQDENRQLHQQLKQQHTQITLLSDQLRQYQNISAKSSQEHLHCGGQACPRCNKCHDFVAFNGRNGSYVSVDHADPAVLIQKRNNATCCVDPSATGRDVRGDIARQNFRRLFFSHVCKCRDT